MDKIKTPEELLDFMSRNIEYGYLGKNGEREMKEIQSDFNLLMKSLQDKGVDINE